MIKAAIFDLDGTLSDTIKKSLRMQCVLKDSNGTLEFTSIARSRSKR